MKVGCEQSTPYTRGKEYQKLVGHQVNQLAPLRKHEAVQHHVSMEPTDLSSSKFLESMGITK